MPRPQSTRLSKGRIFGTVYDFNCGDILDIHTHSTPNNHITLILLGALEAIGDTKHVGKVFKAGDILLDLEPNVSHGFKALAPARMVNILIGEEMEENYEEILGDV